MREMKCENSASTDILEAALTQRVLMELVELLPATSIFARWRLSYELLAKLLKFSSFVVGPARGIRFEKIIRPRGKVGGTPDVSSSLMTEGQHGQIENRGG